MESPASEMFLLLKAILGVDNAQRRAAEERLEEMRKEAEKFVSTVIQVLEGSEEQGVRELCAILLKRSLSFMVENNQCVWSQMSVEYQESLKAELLKLLETEEDRNVGKKLCHVVAELSGTIEDMDQQWGDLDALVYKLLIHDDGRKQEMGYTIVNNVFAYSSERYMSHNDDLFTIFQQTLSGNYFPAKLALFDTLANMLTIVDISDSKQFQPLLPALLDVIRYAQKAGDEDDLKTLLGDLSDITEWEPKFLKPAFEALFELCIQLTKIKYENEKIRHMPIEIVISLCERFSKILEGKQKPVIALLESVFETMIDIPSEVDPEWLKPPEGTEIGPKKDQLEDNVVFGRKAIDRVLSILGGSMTLPILTNMVEKLLMNETDWRYKFVALIGLSQIGEYIEDPIQMNPIMPVIIKHMDYAQPKVRYAAVHCIGQLSDDMPESFHLAYHEKVVSALLSSLDDNAPRIQSHACCSLNNFFDKLPSEIASGYIDQFLPKLMNLIYYGISIVKENAVTSIGSLAEAAPKKFLPYYDGIMKEMLKWLGEAKAREYKKFRAQLIESITLIGEAVGSEVFMKDFEGVIELMLQIQEQELDPKDPQKIYLINAWQRVCMCMTEQMVPYLDRIIPSILKLAASVPGMSIATGGEKNTPEEMEKVLKSLAGFGKDKVIEISTLDIEEKEGAVSMLSVFIDELKGHMAKYIHQASTILIPLVSYVPNETLRKTAAMALRGLLISAKVGGEFTPQQLIQIANEYIQTVIRAMQKEGTHETLTIQAEAVKDLIEETGTFMDQKSIIKLLEIIMGFLAGSNKRKLENNRLKNSDTADDQDKELMEEDNMKEDQLQITYSELIGILFKTHPDISTCLVDNLWPGLLGQYLKLEGQSVQHRFALFLIIDMIEFLGAERLSSIYIQLCKVVFRFGCSPEVDIRQAALYGIGMMAKTAGLLFPHILDDSLNCLQGGIAVDTHKNQNKWLQCRDNGISALGKIIQYQGKNIKLDIILPQWLSLLPIKNDQEEGKLTHQLLNNIIISQPTLIFGQDFANLRKIVEIFGEILETPMVTEGATLQISQILKELNAREELKPKLEEIGNSIDQLMASKLKKCIAMN